MKLDVQFMNAHALHSRKVHAQRGVRDAKDLSAMTLKRVQALLAFGKGSPGGVQLTASILSQ